MGKKEACGLSGINWKRENNSYERERTHAHAWERECVWGREELEIIALWIW